MSDVEFILGYENIYNQMAKAILSTRKVLFLSFFCCDFFQTIVNNKISLNDLLNRLVKKVPEVKIYILIGNRYTNVVPKELIVGNKDVFIDSKLTQPACNYAANAQVRFVNFYNKLPLPIPFLFTGVSKKIIENGINCHHQKYLLSDSNIFMIGGIDINKFYKGNYPVSKNSNNFFWIDSSISIYHPETKFSVFAQRNHTLFGRSQPIWPLINNISYSHNSVEQKDEKFTSLSESKWMEKMIKESKRYVYIESQYFSTNNNSFNKIADYLVERIGKAINENETDFKIIVISNYNFTDDDVFIFRVATRSMYISSIQYITNKLYKLYNLSKEEMKKYIFFGHLVAKDKSYAYIHNKIILVDDKLAIFSSSNLCDRSLKETVISTDSTSNVKFGSDQELGIYFQNPQTVLNIRNTLWNAHFKTGKSECTIEKFWEACQNSLGFIETVEDKISILDIPLASIINQTNNLNRFI